MICDLQLNFGNESTLYAARVAAEQSGLSSVLVSTEMIVGSRMRFDLSLFAPSVLAGEFLEAHSEEISEIKFEVSPSLRPNIQPSYLDKSSFKALTRIGDCLVSIKRNMLWGLPIVLGLGQHNNRPAPTEIAGMLWRWNARCGARVVRLDVDGLVAVRENQFESLQTSADTAKEHLSFNHELFNEYSADEYFSYICNSRVWKFWWD